MPQQQILPTWTALNGGTFTSPTGMTDLRTGQPFAAGGLNIGDWFELTEQEANQLSSTAVGTLHSGRYRFVQFDSGATAANVATGTIGLFKNLVAQNYATPVNYVTTADRAPTLNTPRKVVFLCGITAGQVLTQGVFGFVQEAGDANVLVATVEATPAGPGLVVNTTATGADAPTAQTVVATQVGITTAAPVAGGLCRVQLTSPEFQD